MERKLKTTYLIFLLVVCMPSFCLSVDYDPYDLPGFNSNRETFSSVPYEHYDPFAGGLILTFQDIRLPGNGGLDLVIQRNFLSKNTCNQWIEWLGNWSCRIDDENT